MVENIKQDEVIKNINGIYVVDAGAGTGKTYTITKRYLNIISQPEINPEDILLLTFTKNAAENMKSKISSKLIETNPELNAMSAKISTFHAFCNDILSQGCEDVPKYLDINYRLSPNFTLLENSIIEKAFFRKIYNSFKNKNSKYEKEYDIVGDRYNQILSLIKKLLSKGVFPKKDGWLLDGEKIIQGDKNLFSEIVFDANSPGVGARGPTQSKLLAKFKPKAASKLYNDLEEDFIDDKVIKKEIIDEAFNEERSNWINLVHDIYYFYIEKSLKESKLTFDFLIMFAFLELYYNPKTRKRNSFEYVMIDEFQDTNEMQFMLSLLLLKKNNLSVVGDWKQGIYGFRNATIENITQFDKKIKYYTDLLNKDEERIPFSVESIKQDFDINFRSSKEILDFSIDSLYAKGSDNEEIDTTELKENIVKLSANNKFEEHTEIDFYMPENPDLEAEMVLSKIQELISSDKKIRKFEQDGTFTERGIEPSDIAVLSRTKGFLMKLQELGLRYNIPINYEGGVELFKTQEAILLLAILRIISNKNDKKGWIAILEYFNYSLGDKKEILKTKKYPEDIIKLRKELFRNKKNIISLISFIFRHFKIDSNYSNAIIQNIGNVFSNNLISLENLIYFIEENIATGETYNIDINSSDNAITVQTIHASKGLEYPVVFISNINQKNFPSTISDTDTLSLNPELGLRCSKITGKKNGYHTVFDNWKTDLTKSCILRDYDEERRLLFVAITRAKQYLYLTASNPSKFFKELLEMSNKEPVLLDANILKQKPEGSFNEDFEIKIPKYTKGETKYAVHDLMTYQKAEEGHGLKYGTMIHKMAELIALGEEVSDSQECKELKNFIDSLGECKLLPEVEMSLLIDGNRINGIIDLLAVYDDRVEIIDYKTDMSKLNHKEYVKQMSIYYHGVKEFYNKEVVLKIFYVSLNEVVEVSPLSKEEISKLIE